MTKDESLRRYQEKRDFQRTREPTGDLPGSSQPSTDEGTLRFVIQMHDATRLHFDFRLEADGVLKSWAVPKGPSTDPREKRLAARTEDHPLDYQDFEGVIPEDEYGGGTVIVWDAGTYRNLTTDDGDEVPVAEAVERGHVKFWLQGQKLIGGYALTRTRRGDWLLVKVRDEQADARRNPVSSQPESVLTGRTLDQVAAEEAEAADQA